MAITIGTITAAALDSAGTTLSVTAHNHAGGTDALLLAVLVFRSSVNGLAHTVSATWNGVNMTQALAVPAAAGIAFNDQLCWAGYIRGGTTGARTLVATINRSVNGIAAFLMDLTGVDQSTTIGAAVQNEESLNAATTTATMTTLAANSLVVLACGTTKITTQPTFNSGWTHRVTRQYGASVGLSIQPTPASLATQVKATAGSITGTATWPASSSQRNVSLVEIRASTGAPPPPPTGRDYGVLGVGPITGADVDMGLVLRRDEAGDMGGFADVYSAEAAFADRRHRIESAVGEAVSGKDRAIDLVLSAGTGVAMYIDGDPTAHSYRSATAPTGSTDINAGTLWVGASSRDSATGGWLGLMDELRFHASAFSGERIADERMSQSDGRLVYGLGDNDAYGGSASPVAVPVASEMDTRLSPTVDIDVLSAAINPGGAALGVSIVGQPSNGAASVVGNRVRYTPNAGFNGQDKGSYAVSGNGKSSTGRFTVAVTTSPAPPDQPPPGNFPSGLPWRSGEFDDPSVIPGFGRWRGRAVDVVDAFMGKTYWNTGDGGSWAKMASTTSNGILRRGGTVEDYKDTGYDVAVAVPLLLSSEEGRFSIAADSTHRSYHQSMANMLRAIYGTNGLVFIRLGWEANKGYPWSMDGSPELSSYAAAWRTIAGIYKTTVPGCKMVWNHLRTSTTNVGNYYPGSSVVDVIGLDVYDQGQGISGNYMSTQAGWDGEKGSYNASTGKVTGWGGFIAYARALGKLLSFDEWGATNSTQTAANGANNSFFVQKMFDLMQQNKDIMAFDCYFNGPASHQIYPEVAYNARVSAGYLAKWKP